MKSLTSMEESAGFDIDILIAFLDRQLEMRINIPEAFCAKNLKIILAIECHRWNGIV